MKKTHRGSCHCGGVRVAAAGARARGPHKSNCTNSTKMRVWAAQVASRAVRLIPPL